MPPDRSNLRTAVRRFIAVAPAASAESGVTQAQAACERLYRDLARWTGADGCHALFLRALMETRGVHPLLTALRIRIDAEPRVDGIDEAVRARGMEATAEALEAFLVTVVELLSRFIGEDMVITLMERSAAGAEAGSANPRSSEA
jgi:hypothetical protein